MFQIIKNKKCCVKNSDILSNGGAPEKILNLNKLKDFLFPLLCPTLGGKENLKKRFVKERFTKRGTLFEVKYT